MSPKTISFFAATSHTKLCHFLPYIHRITSHLPFCCAIIFRYLHSCYSRSSNKLLVRNRTNLRCHIILQLLYPTFHLLEWVYLISTIMPHHTAFALSHTPPISMHFHYMRTLTVYILLLHNLFMCSLWQYFCYSFSVSCSIHHNLMVYFVSLFACALAVY